MEKVDKLPGPGARPAANEALSMILGAKRDAAQGIAQILQRL